MYSLVYLYPRRAEKFLDPKKKKSALFFVKIWQEKKTTCQDKINEDMRSVGVKTEDALDRVKWRSACAKADPALAGKR